MNDEAALLSAIIAHAGEDTPRLAYADWLEEHDAPVQADFIRTQCRLAACSPADPEYPDLVERHAEVAAQFGRLVKMTVPELPPGFAFHAELKAGSENFRRGFLNTVHGDWHERYGEFPTDDDLDRFCAGLPHLIATTTARELVLSEVTAEQLARVLAAPGAGALTGLVVVSVGFTPDSGDDTTRALAHAGATANLERLYLYAHASAAGIAALAAVPFRRLAHLDLPTLTGRARDLAPLTGAKWFRELRSARVGQSDPPVETALVSALAKLPRLEALDLRCNSPEARKALAAPRGFPALARLAVWSRHTTVEAQRLARASFPRLADLYLGSASNASATPLLRADWFPRLRRLAFDGGRLTDKFVVALAKNGAAANLRALRLANNRFGPPALAALADGARFPNVSTLDLETTDAGEVPAADVAAFAKALSLPRLRHLDLSGWPLGDAGAKALAANPALANLTRLALRNCGVGERGLTALARSKHLQQLIELDVEHNKLKTAAALCDTDLLPRLTAVRLTGNAIPVAALKQLHAARGLVV